MKYEIIKSVMGSNIIKKISDDGSELFIPTDPGNSDYQQYLLWLEEQA